MPSRIRRLLPSTVLKNVTVINTRDEHGETNTVTGFTRVGTNAVAFGSLILAATPEENENKKGAFPPPSNRGQRP